MEKSLEEPSEMSPPFGTFETWQKIVRLKSFASLGIVSLGQVKETMSGFSVDWTEVLEMMNGFLSSLELVRNIWICGLQIIDLFV